MSVHQIQTTTGRNNVRFTVNKREPVDNDRRDIVMSYMVIKLNPLQAYKPSLSVQIPYPDPLGVCMCVCTCVCVCVCRFVKDRWVVRLSCSPLKFKSHHVSTTTVGL